MEHVPKNVIAAGQEIADNLIDASCHYNMTGLGGCKLFDINNFPVRNHDLIIAYIEKEMLSVTAIYIAMNREIKKG